MTEPALTLSLRRVARPGTTFAQLRLGRGVLLYGAFGPKDDPALARLREALSRAGVPVEESEQEEASPDAERSPP